MKDKIVKARKTVDYKNSIITGQNKSFGVSNDGSVLLLNLDDTHIRNGLKSFDQELNYKLYVIKNGDVRMIKLDPINEAFNQVYLLPEEKILLVGHSESGENGIAYVYNFDGKLSHRFEIGPDLDNLVVDASGNLWVNYKFFNRQEDGLISGVRKFDIEGNVLFEKSKHDNITFFSDLLINIDANDDLWLLHNNAGSPVLLKLSESEISDYQPLINLRDCMDIAVHDQKIGFIFVPKEYERNTSMSIIVTPFDSCNGMARFNIVDEEEEILTFKNYSCCCNTIILFADDAIYELKIGVDL